MRNQEAKQVRNIGSLIFETPIQDDYEASVEARSLLPTERLEEMEGRLAVTDEDSSGNRHVKFWVDEAPTSPTERRTSPMGDDVSSRVPPAHSFAPGVHTNYCGCDIYIHSAIEVSDESSVHIVSDEAREAWEALFVPSSPSHRDPNRAPTVVAPSTPVPVDEETPSIPETPRLDPDKGGTPPEEPALGVATKIDAKDGVTQTPPLLTL